MLLYHLMITKPTVLVLGAGASAPYGFPTGAELKQIILENLASGENSQWYDNIKHFGHSKEEIQKFAFALKHSGKSSVDAFLEHRQDFLWIGKFAIALSLIPFEEEYKLYDPPGDTPPWYDYIWEKLDARLDQFGENKLSIITFNYDRSLEQFLYSAIKNLYNRPDGECRLLMDCIPIIHVHGSLGNLRWQGEPYSNYLPAPNHTKIDLAAQNISIISDISDYHDRHTVFSSAFNFLSGAEQIYFLGFGYNDTNLKRLKIDQLGNTAKTGTAWNVGKAERNIIEKKWRIETPGPPDDVLGFLKNYAYLE
jgi:hypothetical protein